MSCVILCNGVFDTLHVGHLWHLEAAREMGDELWVSVTDDANVNKGEGRPIHPQEHRLALIKALRVVNKAFTVSNMIEAIDRAIAMARPNQVILVKGIDYSDGLHEYHEKYCRNHGVEIKYTKTEKLSTTQLIHEARRRSGL